MVTPPFYPNQRYAQVTRHDTRVVRSRSIVPDVAAARGARNLHEHHRRMLEEESGISPEVIADRGYWTETDPSVLKALGYADYQCRPAMGPFLVIPEWTTAGVQRGSKIRPDRPRLSKKAKPIKYESPAGSQLQVDCPPGITHLLRDRSIPLYVTEGSKKADAAVSRGLPCISISGVWAFRRGRVVLPDFDDIALDGREVRPAFDDDVMVKPEVRAALDTLNHALLRRGATVRPVMLCDPAAPDAPAGSAKVGLDDFLVRAGNDAVAMLDRLTMDWTPPPATWDEPSDTDVDHWKPRALRAEADLRALIALHDNPHLSSTEKTLVRRLATEGAAKAARGERTEDGRVQLEPRFLANDHRSEPDHGEARAKRNPDGTAFLMPRSSVKKTAERLRGLGLLDFQEIRVPYRRKHGRPYSVPELLISPPASIADFVAAAAWYAPAVPVSRADYGSQAPCPSCGETHERTVRTTRRTYCGTPADPGCGTQIGETETVMTLPVPPANRPDITEHQRQRLDQRTSPASIPTKNVDIEPTLHVPSCPAPIDSLPTKNVEIEFDHAGPLWSSAGTIDHPGDDVPPEPTGPAPGWEADRRHLYGRLYREAAP